MLRGKGRLGVIALILASAGCTDPAARMVIRADDLVFTGHYEQAAREYESVLVECGDKSDTETRDLRRSTLEKLGQVRQHYLNDPRGALRAYRASADLAPKSEEAFQVRLRSVRLLRDVVGDAAAAAVELGSLLESFAQHPGIGSLRLELAELAFRARRYEDAKLHADAVLAGEDTELRIGAAMLLAAVHEVQGRPEAALQAYRALLEMPLDEALASRVRFELALCHERLKDLAGALEQYELAQAGASDPSLVAARLARVRALLAAAKTAVAPIHAAAPPPRAPLNAGAAD